MKRLATILTILLFTVPTAFGASTNLLLGKWKLDSATKQSPYCENSFEFTPKALIRTTPGKTGSTPVTYVTGDAKTFPTVVYVMTDAGIAYHTTYRFLSKDKMILDTALQCVYLRP